jgi:hypothetical protein
MSLDSSFDAESGQNGRDYSKHLFTSLHLMTKASAISLFQTALTSVRMQDNTTETPYYSQK